MGLFGKKGEGIADKAATLLKIEEMTGEIAQLEEKLRSLGIELPQGDVQNILHSVAGGFDKKDVQAYTEQLRQRIEELRRTLEQKSKQ